MVRLADFISSPDTSVEPTPVEADTVSAAPEEVFHFPDHPQPTVKETVGRMVRQVVVPGEPTADEMDAMWARAEASDAPEPSRIGAAFDRGARLSMPEPKDEPMDPALKVGRKRRNPGGRSAGSDEFTDLFAAGLIMLISFTIGDEFLPTEDEAKDLARPLGNILARRIDLAKKLGQDANDVVAFAVALMAYMVRVGPIAADRVRESYNDRQQRSRTDRIAGSPYGGGADSVVAGEAARTGSPSDASHNPLDALAKARATQFGVLDRDLGGAPNGHLAVAD